MLEEVALNNEVHKKENPESDSFDDDEDRPRERWAPLGAANPSPTPKERYEMMNQGRLRELEEEQEQLNSALFSLTSHFAQVQFRLQQVCHASPTEKEKLLADLTEFASRGCPDIMEVKRSHSNRRPSIASSEVSMDSKTVAEHEEIIEKQRMKQLQLISQLKEQLEDLERFAYESGEGGLPSGELMAKQRVILDSLQSQIDLPVGQIDKLSNEELQKHVDEAVRKLVNPMKLKDQLVDQLKTQIDDLTRFIDFLQVENRTQCTCLQTAGGQENFQDSSGAATICPVHHPNRKNEYSSARSFGFDKRKSDGKLGAGAGNLLAESFYLTQIYLLEQMGCQSRQKFHKNELKKNSKGGHWGDLRAAVEISIDKVCEFAKKDPVALYGNSEAKLRSNSNSNQNSISNSKSGSLTRTAVKFSDDEDEEGEDVFSGNSPELIGAVRKNLCPALRDLLQHGMLPAAAAKRGQLIPVGCFPTRSQQVPASSGHQRHAWEMILHYYEMKHGPEFNDAPVRKLSQSFNLESIGGKAITSKQLLLGTVDNILSSHRKLKRSPDAHFKAFVSAALNQRKLIAWLRMILRTREVVEENYSQWSYVYRTGFDDCFKSLERLHQFHFDLPVDLAVRPFQNIKDAF